MCCRVERQRTYSYYISQIPLNPSVNQVEDQSSLTSISRTVIDDNALFNGCIVGKSFVDNVFPVVEVCGPNNSIVQYVTGPVTGLAFRLRTDYHLNIRLMVSGQLPLVQLECGPIVRHSHQPAVHKPACSYIRSSSHSCQVMDS